MGGAGRLLAAGLRARHSLRMRKSDRIKELADGVRALELLARHAPIELPDFARLAMLPHTPAAALVQAFEQSGYVRRVPGGSLLALTMLGLTLVASDNPAGALVARAAGTIGSLGRAGGRTATLSIRRGGQMLVCLSSDPAADGLVGTRRPVNACPQGLTQITGAAMLDGDTIAIPVFVDDGVAGVLSFHGMADRSPSERDTLVRLLANEAHRLVTFLSDRRGAHPFLARTAAAVPAARLH